jgi:hypothetical protein
MQRHIQSSFLQKIMNSAISKRFMLTPEQGAQSVIQLAYSPELKGFDVIFLKFNIFLGVSGKYFNKLKKAKSSRRSYNVGLQKKLWEVSENLTGIKFLQ